jgi:hypothetical protein
MNPVLDEALTLFKQGARNEAFFFLSKIISDETQTCQIDDDVSTTMIDELISQCLQEMTRSSLEILSWIFSSDFVGKNAGVREALSSLESANSAVVSICNAIDSSDEETTCFALFIVSEQCTPYFFEKHVRRIGSLLFACLNRLRPRNIRLYAYRAMLKMFPCIKQNNTDRELCELSMNVNMVNDWKSEDQKLREASLELAEVCTNESALLSLLPNAEKETKDLMQHMW